LCYLLLKFNLIPYYISFFYLSHFFTLLYLLKLDLNFEDFHLLNVIANILLKISAFIRSLNMHLYQSNINYSKKLIFAAFILYSYIMMNASVESQKFEKDSHNFGIKKKAVWKSYNTRCSVNARAFSQVLSGSLGYSPTARLRSGKYSLNKFRKYLSQSLEYSSRKEEIPLVKPTYSMCVGYFNIIEQ